MSLKPTNVISPGFFWTDRLGVVFIELTMSARFVSRRSVYFMPFFARPALTPLT